MRKIILGLMALAAGWGVYSYLLGGYALVEDTSDTYTNPKTLWVGYSAGQCHREKIKMLVKQPGWWTYNCEKVPFGTMPGKRSDEARYAYRVF